MFRLATVLILMAFLAGCTEARGSATRSATEVSVARRTVEDVFLLTGELQAVSSDELTVPKVEGWRVQIKWLAEDGSEVQAGQPVAELDATQVAQGLEEKRLKRVQAQIALDEREASLEAEASQKRFDLAKAETEAEKARIEAAVPVELRSRKEWHEKQQALRRAEVEREKAALALRTFENTSQADLAVLRITKDKATREVTAAETALGQLSLVAPKAGVVMLGRSPQEEERRLQPGDNIWAGWRVASIPNVDKMEVIAFLPEVDDGRVAPGQPARVILESDLKHALPGRVQDVAAVAQDNRVSGGFRVRVALENTDNAFMRPGLSARVEVIREVFENVLVVPRRALVRSAAGWTVRRPDGGRPVDVSVTACLPLDCVVGAGLSEGDRVVLP